MAAGTAEVKGSEAAQIFIAKFSDSLIASITDLQERIESKTFALRYYGFAVKWHYNREAQEAIKRLSAD